MKIALFIIVSLFHSTLWAGLGEATSSTHYEESELLVKSYIEAHRKVLAQRVEKYNKEGLNWVTSEIENPKDASLIKSQIDRTRTRKLHPIRRKNNTYYMKVGGHTFSYNHSDLLMDRIYINGEEFNLSKKETLSEFQDRLYSFITKPKAKKTSFLNLVMDQAHAYPIDRSRAHDMVILNATGVISISYEKPWFWEVGEYSASMAFVLAEEVNAAYKECSDKTSEMNKSYDRRMSGYMKKIIDSMKEEGEITEARLISSILKKYSKKNRIDREDEHYKGNYKPIQGECKSLESNNPGLVMQMFPESNYAPVLTGASYSQWVKSSANDGRGGVNARQGICSALKKTVSCLENLEVVNAKNINESRNEAVIERIVDFGGDTVYDEVSGTHAISK